jgi:hypothetical protein
VDGWLSKYYIEPRAFEWDQILGWKWGDDKDLMMGAIGITMAESYSWAFDTTYIQQEGKGKGKGKEMAVHANCNHIFALLLPCILHMLFHQWKWRTDISSCLLAIIVPIFYATIFFIFNQDNFNVGAYSMGYLHLKSPFVWGFSFLSFSYNTKLGFE